ncbi:MAG: DNA mismatch endonuclease Vsr [Oscillospiraceae bacterium]|nr:DNA mismatch endonuclease Vsr [Oscillospiraceae bacterium]
MADNHTKEVRSYNMSRIRSNNTKPEVRVRSYLHKCGFRFRKNDKRYPGKPDIVLPKYNTVVFVNGCFWHKHNCPRFVMPKSNTDYWSKKIDGNVKRDAEHYQKLKALGWRVIVVWECEVSDEQLQKLADSIRRDYNGIA